MAGPAFRFFIAAATQTLGVAEGLLPFRIGPFNEEQQKKRDDFRAEYATKALLDRPANPGNDLIVQQMDSLADPVHLFTINGIAASRHISEVAAFNRSTLPKLDPQLSTAAVQSVLQASLDGYPGVGMTLKTGRKTGQHSTVEAEIKGGRPAVLAACARNFATSEHLALPALAPQSFTSSSSPAVFTLQPLALKSNLHSVGGSDNHGENNMVANVAFEGCAEYEYNANTPMLELVSEWLGSFWLGYAAERAEALQTGCTFATLPPKKKWQLVYNDPWLAVLEILGVWARPSDKWDRCLVTLSLGHADAKRFLIDEVKHLQLTHPTKGTMHLHFLSKHNPQYGLWLKVERPLVTRAQPEYQEQLWAALTEMHKAGLTQLTPLIPKMLAAAKEAEEQGKHAYNAARAAQQPGTPAKLRAIKDSNPYEAQPSFDRVLLQHQMRPLSGYTGPMLSWLDTTGNNILAVSCHNFHTLLPILVAAAEQLPENLGVKAVSAAQQSKLMHGPWMAPPNKAPRPGATPFQDAGRQMVAFSWAYMQAAASVADSSDRVNVTAQPWLPSTQVTDATGQVLSISVTGQITNSNRDLLLGYLASNRNKLGTRTAAAAVLRAPKPQQQEEEQQPQTLADLWNDALDGALSDTELEAAVAAEALLPITGMAAATPHAAVRVGSEGAASSTAEAGPYAAALARGGRHGGDTRGNNRGRGRTNSSRGQAALDAKTLQDAEATAAAAAAAAAAKEAAAAAAAAAAAKEAAAAVAAARAAAAAAAAAAPPAEERAAAEAAAIAAEKQRKQQRVTKQQKQQPGQELPRKNVDTMIGVEAQTPAGGKDAAGSQE